MSQRWLVTRNLLDVDDVDESTQERGRTFRALSLSTSGVEATGNDSSGSNDSVFGVDRFVGNDYADCTYIWLLIDAAVVFPRTTMGKCSVPSRKIKSNR